MQIAIWIVDYGSQYTQLITRRVRELGYSSEILTVEGALDLLKDGHRPKAIVLSGGPNSVADDNFDYSLFFESQIPILGICYGLQVMTQYFKGRVEKGIKGEYGKSLVKFEGESFIKGCPDSFQVWMSHFDHVAKAPEGFEVFLTSSSDMISGIRSLDKSMIGLQFHPEVNHSQFGKEVLSYFFKEMASLSPDWTAQQMLEECLAEVKLVGDAKVLCAFSGGVDSLVAASMSHQILGDNLYCFFVDNGLLRPQDYHHIEELKENTPLNIYIIDAKETFLNNLKGIFDPEEKRKIIGKTFIDVFEERVHHFENKEGIKFKYLLQGTLYPDVIESRSPHEKDGKSVTIKSHHNVGGLPETMKLELLEPLKLLFKDEVREIGSELGLKKEWVWRHPFPGPGLGVRILGELDADSIRKVQQSDQVLFEELKEQNLYDSTWQAFTVLLPVFTVGVKGDARRYEQVIALRMVNSIDGMTADVTEVPFEFLNHVSSRICNEVDGITRVVYDVTSKPPGTIEWE